MRDILKSTGHGNGSVIRRIINSRADREICSGPTGTGRIALTRNLQEENLFQKMKKVVEDKKQYDLIRKNAYDFSLEFKWDNTSESFDEFISSIRSAE